MLTAKCCVSILSGWCTWAQLDMCHAVYCSMVILLFVFLFANYLRVLCIIVNWAYRVLAHMAFGCWSAVKQSIIYLLREYKHHPMELHSWSHCWRQELGCARIRTAFSLRQLRSSLYVYAIIKHVLLPPGTKYLVFCTYPVAQERHRPQVHKKIR